MASSAAKSGTSLPTQARPGMPWYHFIRRSGEGGERWTRDFQRHGGPRITNQIDAAIVSLRRRQCEKGRQLLVSSQVDIGVIGQRGAPPSIQGVLNRWLLSAWAYMEYVTGRYVEALRALDEADRAVGLAIEDCPHLVMLACHCYDFRLQRARVHRQRQAWSEMREETELGRLMLEDHQPLCVLGNGVPVYLSAVDDFYHNMIPGNAEEEALLEQLLDRNERRRTFEKIAKSNYALSWIVIPR